MLWINGRESDHVSARDRGLAYGDGVFETMRIVNGKLPLWRYHRERLLHGLDVLGIPVEQELLEAEVARVAHRHGSGVLKLTVTRGTGGRAYQPPAAEETHVTRILEARPLEPDPRKAAEGVDVIVCDTVIGTHPMLAGLKHLNRLEQVLAAREVAAAGADEGLMHDAGGCLAEGTFTNLFIVANGSLLTPRIRGGVAGVMRRYVIECASAGDIPCEEAALDLEAVRSASEVFLCNSVAGIWPVRSLDRHPLRSGTITRRLQDRIESLFTE